MSWIHKRQGKWDRCPTIADADEESCVWLAVNRDGGGVAVVKEKVWNVRADIWDQRAWHPKAKASPPSFDNPTRR